MPPQEVQPSATIDSSFPFRHRPSRSRIRRLDATSTAGLRVGAGRDRPDVGTRDGPVFSTAYPKRTGGAATINQYFAAGLIDELRLHVVPFSAGVSGGSRIFEGVPPAGLDFDVVSARHTQYVTRPTYRGPDRDLDDPC